MRHFLSIIIFLAAFGRTEEQMTYEGLRLDMSALTLNRDIIASFVPALNETYKHNFADVQEAGSFFTHLYISKIKITSYNVIEARFNMTGYVYNPPVYAIVGHQDAIFFDIAFEYRETWLGIPISSGTGKGQIVNVKSSIYVFWNESDPDVQLPHPWDTKNIRLTGSFAPTDWVQRLMHRTFVPVFHQVVDKAMDPFAHNLLKTYRYIEDVFPDDFDLVFRNEILSVKPTVNGDYFSIAFKTNITVNQHIHKKFYRRMTGVVAPRGDFDYCFSAELVPNVLEAMSKGKYYDMEIPFEYFGFNTNKTKEWCEILPTECKTYPPDAEFQIHLSASTTHTVNDLGKREDTYFNQLQQPYQARVTVPGYLGELLDVEIFFRFYYEMKCKEKAFIGHISASELYNFRTPTPMPESKRRLLEDHLAYFAAHFNEVELLSPGIMVIPNRHNELNFTFAYINTDEICFYYDEIRD